MHKHHLEMLEGHTCSRFENAPCHRTLSSASPERLDLVHRNLEEAQPKDSVELGSDESQARLLGCLSKYLRVNREVMFCWDLQER
jgi:hypothetical protein